MTETPLIIIHLSPRQHIGWTVKNDATRILAHPEYRAEVEAALVQLLAALRSETYPFSFLRPDEPQGKLTDAEVNAVLERATAPAPPLAGER